MINIINVKKFCNEDITLIENYEKAINDTQTWDCHHRKETDEGLSLKQLKELGLYYDRPASELIFLTKSEHRSLHHQGKNHHMYGKHHSEETKKKQSDSHKGIHPSEETRKKQSESMKGKVSGMKGKHHSKETKKKQSDSHKNQIPKNKGKHRVYDENGNYHYEF